MNFKKMLMLAIGLAVCFTTTMTATAAENSPISPALSYMEKKIAINKCGVFGEKVEFSKKDFDGVFRSQTEFVKIKTLPDIQDATLRLGKVRLLENQLVDRSCLDKITLVPAKDGGSEICFSVSNATVGEPEVEVLCRVQLVQKENQSPVVRDMSIQTFENISAFKFLKGDDPEGNPLEYHVVSYPRHGTVRIGDKSAGYFSYTPKNGFVGEDYFEYAVADSYGGKSNVARVDISVEKRDKKDYFDDMNGHWSYNCAIKTGKMGLMSGEYDNIGGYNFIPDGTVTRGDFLAMALISAGRERDISFVTKTSFSDDRDIPMNIKSYAEYARKCGVVTGYTHNGSTNFDSTSPITRSEAAVIVDRILRDSYDFSQPSEAYALSVFADGADIPHWAEASVSNLIKCGIIGGTGFGEIMPDSNITRAQTAEILCNIYEYVNP